MLINCGKMHTKAEGTMKDNTPEIQACDILNIDMVCALGGNKIQSSSGLVNTLFASKSTKSEMAEFQKLLENIPL